METSQTSRRYTPLTDRPALLHAAELACWVPRDAVTATEEYLHSAGSLPPCPKFMGLILRLNKARLSLPMRSQLLSCFAAPQHPCCCSMPLARLRRG